MRICKPNEIINIQSSLTFKWILLLRGDQENPTLYINNLHVNKISLIFLLEKINLSPSWNRSKDSLSPSWRRSRRISRIHLSIKYRVVKKWIFTSTISLFFHLSNEKLHCHAKGEGFYITQY